MGYRSSTCRHWTGKEFAWSECFCAISRTRVFGLVFLPRTRWRGPRVWTCCRSSSSLSYEKTPTTTFCSMMGLRLTFIGGFSMNIYHSVELDVLSQTLICLLRSSYPDPHTSYHVIFSCGDTHGPCVCPTSSTKPWGIEGTHRGCRVNY
jgi:hypothetical protein